MDEKSKIIAEIKAMFGLTDELALELFNNAFGNMSEIDIEDTEEGDFEGYSEYDIYLAEKSLTDSGYPLIINDIDTGYDSIPLFRQIKKLLSYINTVAGLKLTSTGNLPPAVVKDIYSIGSLEKHIESGIIKLRIETDSISVQLAKIIIINSGLVKKRKGILTLTKAGEKIIDNDSALWKVIVKELFTNFDKSYFDIYGYHDIGNIGIVYVLILLSRYGKERQPYSFYAEKYFKAYPSMLDGLGSISSGHSCFKVRVFERLMHFLGIIKYEESTNTFAPEYVTKTPLFDKLFTVVEPREEVDYDNEDDSPDTKPSSNVVMFRPTHESSLFMEDEDKTQLSSAYQLKISIKGMKPPVWRKVIVDSSLQLESLHQIIQLVMPWSDMHLHQFETKYEVFVPPSEVDFGIDYTDIHINDILYDKGDRVTYIYDFGDMWKHDILVEKVLPPLNPKAQRAEYVKGKGACPPEDCGGVYGFYMLQEALANPKSKEYEMYAEYYSDEEIEDILSNKQECDADVVNESLKDIC